MGIPDSFLRSWLARWFHQWGTIGFVGLIIPHIARPFVGSDHRRPVPTALAIGAIFILWADACARTIPGNAEVPIGILTAVVGAPFSFHHGCNVTTEL